MPTVNIKTHELKAMREIVDNVRAIATTILSGTPHGAKLINLAQMIEDVVSRIEVGETCPRKLTREQIVEGLQAGHVLVVDRKDAPELDDLLALEREGLVTQELVEIDEQSSVIRWRWKKD